MPHKADNRPPQFQVIATSSTGICVNTKILTVKGDIAIQDLKPGDRIITRAGGLCYLRAIKARKAKVHPILIKAGSLGHSRPDMDVVLTPDTQIHIRDWRAQALYGTETANVAAERLIDGEFVSQQPWRLVDLYDLTFDEEQIVYANGVEIVTPMQALGTQ